MTLATLREQYERDGFLLHQQSVLPDDLLNRAIAGLDAVRNGDFDTGLPPHGVYDADAGAYPDEKSMSEVLRRNAQKPGSLTKIEQPQRANFALREAIASAELGRLAAAITGAKWVQVWWVQLLHKPATTGATQSTNIGWHQDKQYWKDWSQDSELFTAWLALSDVTPEAGPMIFVPGSQKWGLLDEGNFFSGDNEAIRGGIHVPPGESWREVPAVLPPGGVSFHHRLTFHGSGPNVSGRPRRSMAIHLRTDRSEVKPDAWPAKFLDDPAICPVIFGAKS